MRARSVVLAVLAVAGFVAVAPATAAEDLTKKCNNYVNNVASCLDYATGKAQTPTSGCCKSAGEIAKNAPACLCYVVQQVHNGSQEVKQLGIQEGRLLQLPSACKLNVNVSDCPKLLNISASSPDAAIFTNASSGTAAPSTPTSTSSPTTSDGSGSGPDKHGPSYIAGIVALVIAVFFSSSPFDVAPSLQLINA